MGVVDERGGDEFEAWPGRGRGADDGVSGVGAGRWGRGGRRTGAVTGVLAPLAQALAGLAGPQALDDQSLSEAVVDFQRVRSLLDSAASAYVARHEQAERAKRRCRMVPVGDGWQLSAHFDRVGGAIVHTALERIVQELFETEWARAAAALDDPTVAAPVLRTASQRHLDALVELARRAGATGPHDQAPKPLISVVVSGAELFGPIRETFNGLVLSRLDVARLLTEADFESIVFDDTTAQPVTVSSRARFFTGALRRAVEVRDRVCQHPTCRVEAEYCQIDHVIEVNAGGPTNVANGRLLCGVHNRQRPGRQPHHRHGDSDGDPDQPRAT